jgi:hypothetical protein
MSKEPTSAARFSDDVCHCAQCSAGNDNLTTIERAMAMASTESMSTEKGGSPSATGDGGSAG